MIEPFSKLVSPKWSEELISRCLEEDGVHQGDITSISIVEDHVSDSFAVNARQSGVLSGLHVLMQAPHLLGDVVLHPKCSDGDRVHGLVATLEGNLRSVLAVERTILNILGYASGVATQTAKFVEALQGMNCEVCDTRKTTPGLRVLDKYAVGCGGGTLHRLGLHDAALYKDNHISGVPIDELGTRLGRAISQARADRNLSFVEVEVDTMEQFAIVLELDVDIILLDNMTEEMLREAVEMRKSRSPKILLEASGGITIDTARTIAETGVDRLAVGGLIHRSRWLDLGLDAING
ncbi:MAG: carboxylating nicotinate-nucleotide diphosphorylase [Planctomycetes bacterium]|nr:carboxylating nicotinate-nucleotide diphosphorylase [Planctomycetota bacterium]